MPTQPDLALVHNADEAVARLVEGLPTSLAEVPTSAMPLVLPSVKLLMMLEAALPLDRFAPFVRHGTCSTIVQAGRRGGHPWAGGNDETEQGGRFCGGPMEVDFDRFAAVYWPHMEERLRK